MEDAHVTLLNLYPNVSYFAVFDGHAGDAVAKYCGQHLHEAFPREPKALEADDIKAVFLNTDAKLPGAFPQLTSIPGCTANVAIVERDADGGEKLWVANTGDSRAVLSSFGKAIEMSHDHKPGNPEEVSRIEKAGGFVQFGRVNGTFA